MFAGVPELFYLAFQKHLVLIQQETEAAWCFSISKNRPGPKLAALSIAFYHGEGKDIVNLINMCLGVFRLDRKSVV